jgi:hypothetical protein
MHGFLSERITKRKEARKVREFSKADSMEGVRQAGRAVRS